MLRQGQFKYHYYVGYGAELFDLQNDPLELENLVSDKSNTDRVLDFEKQLREIVDPETADRQAKEAQARLVVQFGGIETALQSGTRAETPPPAV